MRARYFAYGSNMSPNVISQVCSSCSLLGPAKLADHRLAFTRWSTKHGGGVADILPAPGMVVWGVLYEIDETEINNLDRKEGYGRAYTRSSVDVVLQDEVIRRTMTYTVISKEPTEIPPSSKYLDTMLEGAKQSGLPNIYIRFLESLKADENRSHRRGFLISPTESRRKAGGMNLLKVSRSVAKNLGLRTSAVVVYGAKACLVRVVHFDALGNDACQIDQTVRRVLGLRGRERYGTYLSLFPVAGRGLTFPFVKPRSLTLPLHSPSVFHSEKNICVLHADNIRLLGLNEGEYVSIRTAVLGQNGKYQVRKHSLRVFTGSQRKVKTTTGPEAYPKVDRIYLDLDGRLKLGIPKDVFGSPAVVCVDISRLFASRLLYYGIALFLGLVALTPLVREATSILGISRMASLPLALLFSAGIALLLCIFDIRGKVHY